MSAVAERSAVGQLMTGWTSNPTNPPVAWPNKVFTPPQGARWLRVTIQQGTAFLLEMTGPNKVHRHPGMVVIQCFAPLDQGDEAALADAEAVALLFRNQLVSITNGQIRFRTPTIKNIGPSSKDPYYQVNVTIPFLRDYLY